MIKFSALNDSESSDDDDEERQAGGGDNGQGGVGGACQQRATKEAQEARVVHFFKTAIEAQQKGTLLFLSPGF